jgi:hypothetical protein
LFRVHALTNTTSRSYVKAPGGLASVARLLMSRDPIFPHRGGGA